MVRFLATQMIACIAVTSFMFAPAECREVHKRQITRQLELGELPKGDADGFVTIIRSNDLKVWKGLADYWYSRDGVIGGHQTQENSKQTFLVFPYRLRDFELRLKYKFLTPQGNSGIQFRSKLLDQKTWRVGGYQADIDATGRFDGSLYDEAGVAGRRDTLSNRGDRTTWNAENKREAIKVADSEELFKTIRIGDWNDVTLVVRGNHITYSINGRVMTELIDDSPNAVREGFLALQLHQGFSMEVQFKDAKVRKLD